jgi:lipoprotein-anchoring transpeptidase ErfK/SrfK
MVRNESVARMVMFLCFGAAILSLAVHWRVVSTQQQLEAPASAQEKFPASVGETSLGASTTAAEPIPRQNNQGTSRLKSSAVQPDSWPDVRRQSNVDKKPRSLFARFSAQPKSAHRQGSTMQVVVDLSDRRTYVYKGDLVIASYPIAIGKKGWETPTGSFQVMNMQHDPIWRHPITGKVFEPGSDSPLGERWIGFWTDGRNEIGFHGTPDIHLLGTAISHGCLRMRNSDVRLLYDQVKVGTEIVVRH